MHLLENLLRVDEARSIKCFASFGISSFSAEIFAPLMAQSLPNSVTVAFFALGGFVSGEVLP